MTDQVEQLIRNFIPWVVAGVALVALGVAFWSQQWPSVRGMIEVSITDLESTWEMRSRTLQRQYEERHYLMYTYEVEGEVYGNSRVRPLFDVRVQTTSSSAKSPFWSTARALGDDFREGSPVEIFYCPLYPGWSCLRPGGYLAGIFLGITAVLSAWLI